MTHRFGILAIFGVLFASAACGNDSGATDTGVAPCTGAAPCTLTACTNASCEPSASTVACATGEVRCGSTCIDPLTSAVHCGAKDTCDGTDSGTACDPGEVCAQGSCAVFCPAGFVKCEDRCIDPELDRNHCGAQDDCTGDHSGAACATGDVCAAGSCAQACPAGFLICDAHCVDPAVDRNYCGASDDCSGASAGTSCASGEVCAQGSCAVSCPVGFVQCADRCIDPEIDPRHCGAGADCAGGHSGAVCAAGEVCAAGSCAQACPAGFVICDAHCVDPAVDRNYCGASDDCAGANAGTACASSEVCAQGSCAVFCPAGFVQCGERCIDPELDRHYCGAQGDCAGPNQGTVCAFGEICAGGTCALECPDGFIDCAGSCVDPTADAAHCGAANDCTGSDQGAVCSSGETCVAGVCTLTCAGQLIACDSQCVDAATDPLYCGASNDCTGSDRGNVCANDEVCSGGVCQCPVGLVGCGGQCIDPTTNGDFCGATGDCSGPAAGAVCDPGTEACDGGTCVTKTVVVFTTATPQSISDTTPVLEVQTSSVSGTDSLTFTDTLLDTVTVTGTDGLTLTATSPALRRVDAGGITAGDFTWTAGALSAPLTISGSANGTNTVAFGSAAAVVSYLGGSGNDAVTGFNGRGNIVDLGSGNNTYASSSGNNTITAGDGDDTVSLGSGNNTVTLGNGNNTFSATSGNNTYTGGAGADSVFVGGGSNDLRMGTGTDTVTLTTASQSMLTYTTIRDPHTGLVVGFPDQGTEVFVSNPLPLTVSDPPTATLGDLINASVLRAGDARNNAVIVWFQFGDNTYVIEVRHDTNTLPSFAGGTDILVKLQGSIDLRTATFQPSSNGLTLP